MFRKILAIGLALAAHAAPAFAQAATPVVVNPLPTLVNGQSYPLILDTSGRLVTTVTPASGVTFSTIPLSPNGQGTQTTQVVTSAVASSISSGGGIYLEGFSVTSGASAGYVLVFNTAGAPVDGAVTPKQCYVLAANSTLDKVFYPRPFNMTAVGVTIVFSTTGCFTKTASATAFMVMYTPG